MKWFIIFIFSISIVSSNKSLSPPKYINNETISIYEEETLEKKYKAPIYGSIFSGYWSNRNRFYYW